MSLIGQRGINLSLIRGMKSSCSSGGNWVRKQDSRVTRPQDSRVTEGSSVGFRGEGVI